MKIETVAFILEYGKGLLCLTLEEEQMKSLGIPEQHRFGSSMCSANFGAGFILKSAVMSGSTALARAQTILAAVSRAPNPEDFVMPGQVFPIASVPGGVLKRRGHTEASVDLASLAGCSPAGVICEIMGRDGKMLKGEEVLEFCVEHSLKLTSVQEIVNYRLKKETSIRRTGRMIWHSDVGINRSEELNKKLLEFEGQIEIVSYLDDVDNLEHFALVIAQNKEIKDKDGFLVRIHSECLTGDVFGSQRCDCGEQLEGALTNMLEAKNGILIYLSQEGRGIGLGNKIKAYQLQDLGLDTVEANLHLGFLPDQRDYRVAAQILNDLKTKEIRLMTNNPDKLEALEELGIRILTRVSLQTPKSEYNSGYLNTKRAKMRHLLTP
jgi:3,4-dihydroxy 2-butanone 4-phosphate synthase / GTP cyclohydrolase II